MNFFIRFDVRAWAFHPGRGFCWSRSSAPPSPPGREPETMSSNLARGDTPLALAARARRRADRHRNRDHLRGRPPLAEPAARERHPTRDGPRGRWSWRRLLEHGHAMAGREGRRRRRPTGRAAWRTWHRLRPRALLSGSGGGAIVPFEMPGAGGPVVQVQPGQPGLLRDHQRPRPSRQVVRAGNGPRSSESCS